MKLNKGRIKYILERSMDKSNSNIDLYNIMMNEFEIEINDLIVTIIDKDGNKFNIAWMLAETDTIDSIPEELWTKDLKASGYILTHKKALNLDELEYLVTYYLVEAVNLIEAIDVDLVIVDIMDVIVPANIQEISSYPDLSYAEVLHYSNFMSYKRMLADLITERYIVEDNSILDELLESVELLIVSGAHHSARTYGNGGLFVETPSIREGINSQWVSHKSYQHRKRNPNKEAIIIESLLDEGHAEDASVIWIDLEKINESNSDNNIMPDFEGDVTKAPLVRMKYNPNQESKSTVNRVGNRFENDI